MDLHIISPDCVAFLTQSEDIRAKEPAARLVRRLLEEYGLPQWSAIELDMFFTQDETLVVARPAGVWLPGYAFDFLRRKNED